MILIFICLKNYDYYVPTPTQSTCLYYVHDNEASKCDYYVLIMSIRIYGHYHNVPLPFLQRLSL
jgi:hypothetical protein